MGSKEKLLTEENEWSGEINVEKNEGPCEKVSVKAITKALNLMKTRKATGTSGVTFELLKECKT